jgi:hypothetical protein
MSMGQAVERLHGLSVPAPYACDRWTVSRTRQTQSLKIKPLIVRVTQSVVVRRQLLSRPASTRRREWSQFQRLARVGRAVRTAAQNSHLTGDGLLRRAVLVCRRHSRTASAWMAHGMPPLCKDSPDAGAPFSSPSARCNLVQD